MDINLEIFKLQKSRLLRNVLEVKDFEAAIENILSLNDVQFIRDLCSGFDDQTENQEVMFGLVHAIEDFDGKEGLFELAKAIPSMLPNAKEWAIILNYRILNDNPSRILFIEVLKILDASVRDVIVQILKEIKLEDPVTFGASVDEVLSSL